MADALGGQKISASAIEFRTAPQMGRFRGWIGADIGTQDAYFFGFGVYYGISFPRHVELGLSFGPGYYQGDERLDLGCSVEFRSTVEVSYQFESHHRIALAFGHVSNASLGDVNPGSEFLKITWQLPLDILSRRPARH